LPLQLVGRLPLTFGIHRTGPEPHAVNHYERLKVTQDAPPEVIRAAYRALANRLQAQPPAPGAAADAAQEEMMGLNAAYETLIDPMLRRDYDASLAPGQGWQKPVGDDAEGPVGEGDALTAPAADGAVPGLMAQESAFAPEPSQVMLGTFIALLLIVLGFAWYFTRSGTSGPTMDAALVKQIGEQSNVSADPLDGPVARPLVSAFPGLHPLDGPSIELRSESLLLSARPAAERAAAPKAAD
jgi:curved DNA-binding protein CbpA